MIGNSKSGRIFKRSLPSTIQQLKVQVNVKDSHKVYKESNDKGVFGPRNMKQLQNLRYCINKKKRFYYDEIYNTILLNLELDCVAGMMLIPDVRIVFHDKLLTDQVIPFLIYLSLN